VHVPAICDNCAAIFPSGSDAEDSENITFAGNPAGPCPVCGGAGHIPDGVFSFLAKVIENLSVPPRTNGVLISLAAILTESCRDARSPEEVAERINKEVPELAALSGLFPETKPALYAYLALTVGVISLLLQEDRDKEGPTTVTVERTIDHLLTETKTLAASLSPQLKTPLARNQPCSCGSGKRYKHCCGRLA
jgi:hypothetical protein